MMLIEDFKKGINNSYRRTLLNREEVLKEETQKTLKELQENTTKQKMGLNKTIKDQKLDVE
ncbi:mCG141141, partial [Mus musculus]